MPEASRLRILQPGRITSGRSVVGATSGGGVGRGRSGSAPGHGGTPPGRGGGGHGHGGGPSSVAAAVAAFAALSTSSTGAVNGGGGGDNVSAWTLAVNETGSSYTDFVTVLGTWASNGTVIQQTSATLATDLATRLATNLAIPYVAQVEFLIPSAGAITGQADEHLGIICGTSANSVSGAPIARAVASNEVGASGQIELNGTASRISASIAWTYFDTWHTLRTIYTVGGMSAWLDGTLVGTAGNIGTAARSDAGYIMLLTRNIKANFRNLKVWEMNLSALP